MAKNHKRTSKEKLQIVLEGLRGETNITELCKRHGITTAMFYKWKDLFLRKGEERFSNQGNFSSEMTFKERIGVVEPASGKGSFQTISPYGGKLVNRFVTGEKAEEIRELCKGLAEIRLVSWQLSDLELVAVGGLSPLEGFMTSNIYDSVIEGSVLPSGLPWTIPITLSVSKDELRAGSIKEGAKLRLARQDGSVVGMIEVEDVFKPDRIVEVKKVYGTDDINHPGVKRILANNIDYYIGGRVYVFERPMVPQFPEYHRAPAELRKIFADKGWRSVVAFQTRNPIHRAHEYLQKVALEMVDGLLIHPIVGDTKADDVAADVRMRCYEVLIENYYPKDRVVLSVLPMAMRYAGPMEAVHHCIVRRNYGATHFIVGRDHAGVGSYYGSFDAHKIFDRFDINKLGIKPLFFDHAFYCKKCGSMASFKTCPHGENDRVILSGTKVRQMLSKGQMPPEEFTRKEVAEVLLEAYSRV